MTRSLVVPLQFESQLLPDYEQLLAIVSRHRREKCQRPGSQPLLSVAASVQQRTIFLLQPDVLPAALGALKKEVPAIVRPAPTTFLRTLVPPRRKNWTKHLAVRLHLPQRGNVVLSISQRKSDPSSVRRETQVHGSTWQRSQLAYLAAIRPDQVEIGTATIHDVLSIGRPGGGMGKHIPNPAR